MEDMSFIERNPDDGTIVKHPNCSLESHENSKWLEIKGDEKEKDQLVAHIQRLREDTIKIEDVRRDLDRRGFKCIAYKKSDPETCSASTFFVRVKDKYAALWPFIGIVAEVLVLCIIICVCEKRKASKDSVDDEEEYNGNAISGGGGRHNSSVRQRRA